MKIKIKKIVEVEPATLHVSAEVRYWEDSQINGEDDIDGNMPCRNGEMWEPVIDVKTGRIRNWEQGKTAEVHYKVCDAGIYTLKDDDGNTISEKDGYVPDCMAPGGGGYGDYIIMHIDENGIIAHWSADFEDFPGVENDDE